MEKRTAADTLLTVCTDCKPEEKILFVTDNTSSEVAQLMWESASRFPHKAIIRMEDRTMHGEDPPPHVAAAMAESDVVFGITKYSMLHTNARRYANGKGARYANMADYNKTMFEKGGLFADFISRGKLLDRVSDRLEGERIHITTAAGTDYTASIKGRKTVRQYGISRVAGASSSPPDIETALGPVEGTSEGIIVIDGSIPHPELGVLDEAITLTVREGKIVKITGGKNAETLERIMEKFDDEAAYHVAEIGIGFNDKSVLCNSMLEDEGAMGTAHFGFGSNITFGGNITSSNHLDMVYYAPTMSVDGRLVIEEGRFIL